MEVGLGLKVGLELETRLGLNGEPVLDVWVVLQLGWCGRLVSDEG